LKNKKKNKVGLLGGTFDPPHNAHLQLAGFVLAKLELDCIYFIPAAIHALKKHTATPVEIRYEMIQAAIVEFKSFRVSRIEMQRPKVLFH
jgi:nicotinate-nucleotide adenylyltransferase